VVSLPRNWVVSFSEIYSLADGQIYFLISNKESGFFNKFDWPIQRNLQGHCVLFIYFGDVFFTK
jgi:hypothetical protein